MFKDILVAKLQGLNKKFTISGNEIRTTCMNPNHIDNSPSYFINIVTGVSHCFSCNYSPPPSVLIDMGTEETSELLRQSKYNTLLNQLEDKFSYDTTMNYTFTEPPKAYDINRDWRGTSQELLSKLGAYYCDTGRFAGRLVFPIYNENNIFIGADCRIVSPKDVPEYVRDVKWLRHKDMQTQDIVYPLQLLESLGTVEHIVLCEGMADAISYWQMGVPAIPNFGLSSPSASKIATLIRLGVTTITIALDNDEAGIDASKRLYKDYIKWFKVASHPLASKVFRSGLKDANEYLVQIYNKNKGNV